MTPQEHIEWGIEHLRQARQHFRAAECPRVEKRINRALASADGARRHAQSKTLKEQVAAVVRFHNANQAQ